MSFNYSGQSIILFNNSNRHLFFLLNTALIFGGLKNPPIPVYSECGILSTWHLNDRNLRKLFWIVYSLCNWHIDSKTTHIREPYSSFKWTNEQYNSLRKIISWKSLDIRFTNPNFWNSFFYEVNMVSKR
jgi:hypothetical protein